MADVFSGPHWVSFLFRDQTGRWPPPASKHNKESLYRDSSTSNNKRCVHIELVFTFFSGCLVRCSSASFLLVVDTLYFSLKMSPSSSSSANRSIGFLGLTFSCSAIRRGNQSNVLRGKDSIRTWVLGQKFSYTYRTFSDFYHWRSHHHPHLQTDHLVHQH